MDKPTTTTEGQVEQAAPEPKIEKPYEPPAIIYRAPLEAMAGVCGGTASGKAVCTCVNS